MKAILDMLRVLSQLWAVLPTLLQTKSSSLQPLPHATIKRKFTEIYLSMVHIPFGEVGGSPMQGLSHIATWPASQLSLLALWMASRQAPSCTTIKLHSLRTKDLFRLSTGCDNTAYKEQ
eukprot:4793529-Amphidinium_carterae.1